MSEPRAGNDLDFRLPAIRIRDVILAALQMSFAQDNLLGPERQNIYRYVPGDPAKSLLWISSGDARVDGSERDGRRLLITVTRGDYTPQELHLQNHAGGGMGGATDWSDLGTSYIFVACEAGNETASEALASMCYHIIKTFRRDIMRDFDVHNLRLLSISPATQVSAGKGQPYVCRVVIEVKLQEHARQIELSNPWNHTMVRGLMENGKELFKNDLEPVVQPDQLPIVLPPGRSQPFVDDGSEELEPGGYVPPPEPTPTPPTPVPPPGWADMSIFDIDGPVYDQQYVGTVLYLVGFFTSVTGNNGTFARSSACAVDTATGFITPWAPPIPSNTVARAIDINDTHAYIAARFDVGPQQALGRVNLTDGALDTSWDPGISYTADGVRDILIDGDDLYVVGTFTQLTDLTVMQGAMKFSGVSGIPTWNQTWVPNGLDGLVPSPANGGGGSLFNRVIRAGSKIVLGGGFAAPTTNPPDGHYRGATLLLCDPITGAVAQTLHTVNTIVEGILYSQGKLVLGDSYPGTHHVLFTYDMSIDVNSGAEVINRLSMGGVWDSSFHPVMLNNLGQRGSDFVEDPVTGDIFACGYINGMEDLPDIRSIVRLTQAGEVVESFAIDTLQPDSYCLALRDGVISMGGAFGGQYNGAYRRNMAFFKIADGSNQ